MYYETTGSILSSSCVCLADRLSSLNFGDSLIRVCLQSTEDVLGHVFESLPGIGLLKRLEVKNTPLGTKGLLQIAQVNRPLITMHY